MRSRANQLTEVLEGRLDPESAAREVRLLSRTASSVGATIVLPAADPVWAAAFRTRLLTEAIPDPAAIPGMFTRMATSARLAAASGVASALIGSTGVVAAAQEALPGQLLHPVKLLTEDVRLALSREVAGDARLHLMFARERMQELLVSAPSIGAGDLADALSRMDRDSRAASDLVRRAVAAGADSSLVDELVRFLSDQHRDLEVLAASLGEPLLGLVARSEALIGVLTAELDEWRSGPSVGEPVPPETPTVGPTQSEPPTTSSPEPEPTTPTGTPPAGSIDQPRVIVPELPAPLDQLGENVDTLLGDLLEQLNRLGGQAGTSGEPSEGVIDQVDDLLSDLLDNL